MTDRQRFNNQMHYKPIDRCFNMEFGYWAENFKKWPIFVENGITDNNEADIFFNFDKIGTVGGNTWINPPFPEKVVEEVTRPSRKVQGKADVPGPGPERPAYASRTWNASWREEQECNHGSHGFHGRAPAFPTSHVALLWSIGLDDARGGRRGTRR